MANAQQFTLDLKAFAKKIDVDLAKVVRKISLEAFKGVVRRTPVDTGAARASWQIGINQAPAEKVAGTQGSKTAVTATAMQEVAKLSQVKGTDSVFISNAAPYIEKLEYGGYGNGPKTVGGYSKQAPAGMVRVTLAELESKYKKVMAD